MHLRAYQIRAIEALRAAYGRGRRAPCLVMPCGAGKTVVSAAIIAAAAQRGTRTLFVADRTTLIDQTVRKLRDAGLETIRVIQADRDDGLVTAPVTVASAQTLRTDRWMAKLPAADLVIWDECHHVVADTYERTLARYPAARLLGLTATPCRGDNKPLAVYDELVIGSTITELTELGHLVRPRVLAPPSQLEAAEIALDPVDVYRQHAHGGRSALFCDSVEQARRYVAELEAHSITARLVHATSPDRAETLAEFAADGFRVLASVGTLCEGWDDPGCGMAIVARGCGSVGLWLQICGRVLRPYPGKTEGLIVDLRGSVHVHGLPDAEREYSLDGKAISTVRKDAIRQCKTCGSMYAAGPRACPWCGAEAIGAPFQPVRVVGVALEAVRPPTPKREYVIAMTSKHSGFCESCRGTIRPGEEILWATVAKRARHRECQSSIA